MATLNDLTNQFVGLMNRNDLKSNSPLVTTFLNGALLRIQRELRVPMMESSILYTVPTTYVPNTGLAIPNDLLELIGLFAGPNLEYQLTRDELSKVNFMADNPSWDYPKKYARLGGNWVLGPYPLAGSQILIQYYASFTALVAPTDTNSLLQVAIDAPLYAALSYACDYYNDSRVDRFEKRYAQIMQNLQEMADADELSGDAVISPVFNWPEDF